MAESVAMLTARDGRGGDPARARAAKRDRLESILKGMDRTLVAYSGGVDSAYLLVEAHRVLGEKVCGVIADSPSLPRAELKGALSLAEGRGVPVRIVRTDELARDAYRANGPDRCYHCKSELFDRLERIAAEEGWASLAYGAVTDDLGDVRPGMAAAARFRVRAPLLEAGLSKLEVRSLARAMGLGAWDKPQSACLASRIPHGSEVTAERLSRVEAGEDLLRRRFGLRVVRLRHDGVRGRIEVPPAELERLSGSESMEAIRLALNSLGFEAVEIDPAGYRRADPVPSDGMEE